MLQIPDPSAPAASANALFNLGFRPFFLGAALYALLAMLVWMAIYVFGISLLPSTSLSTISWHAHEMIYGYGMAVIAGFLLTAVRNWTGIPTLSGWRLVALFALWALARLSPFLNLPGALYTSALLDLGFALALLIAVIAPIVRAKQWRQLGVAVKLILLGLGNACFYAGLFGWSEQGIRIGIYGGFYLIIALILTMSRRLIPFFTERGVGYAVQLKNRRWLDISSMFLFVLFLILEVFAGFSQAAAATALALFMLHALRLHGWYTHGILRFPLLWGLHAGYAFIIAGFPLYAASVYFGVLPFLSVHAFAVGGIGMVTLAMMARVALGHTGRNVHQPPQIVRYVLLALTIATVFRVFLPLLDMGHYRLWIACSQIFWILAFSGFLLTYFPVLMKPRIDGQPG
ncbi:MAG TPA: NnrS family protein [Gammaproteobacteria bacterium]